MMNQQHDPKRPVGVHFEEMGQRLKRIILYIFVACAVGYGLNTFLVEWIVGPLKQMLPEGASLVYTKPFEKIWVYVRISVYFGVVIAGPFCLLEIFQFVSPVFKRRDLGRQFIWLILSCSLAFTLGIWIGQKWALPAVLRAVFSIADDGILPFLTFSAYVNAAAGILLACAVFLQIPVLMYFLTFWGLIKARFWRKGRRAAIVVNAIISAFLSPPDPLSMILLMIPIFFVYEIGIFLALVAERLSDKKLASGVKVLTDYGN